MCTNMADIIQKIYNVWDFMPRSDVLIGTFATRKAAEECVEFKNAENYLYNDFSTRKTHHYKILECIPGDTFTITKNEELPKLVPVISYYEERARKWYGSVLGNPQRFRAPQDLIEFRIHEKSNVDVVFPHLKGSVSKIRKSWNHDHRFIIFIPYKRSLCYEEYGNLAIPKAMKYEDRYKEMIAEASQVSPLALIRNYKFVPQDARTEKTYTQVLHMIDCSIPKYGARYRTITSDQLQQEFKLYPQEIIDQRFEFRIPKE